jgi:hypothetical protein
MHLVLAAIDSGSAGGLLGACFAGLIELALLVLLFAGMWKAFVKAGEPGWAAIVPIYNAVVLLKIVDKPIWWIILLLIPCISFIIAIILMFAVAKAYGKGAGYAIGLIFLPFVFWPLIGFGDAKYVGPNG